MTRGGTVRAFAYYNAFNSWGWLDTLPKETLSKKDVFTGDIRDPNGVREAMKGVDIVFPLAALIAIPFSYHSPDSYVDTNMGLRTFVGRVIKTQKYEIMHLCRTRTFTRNFWG